MYPSILVTMTGGNILFYVWLLTSLFVCFVGALLHWLC